MKHIIIWRPLPSKGGLGSQLLSKITAIAYCKYNNYTYVHKEWDNIIHRIGHNYHNKDSFESEIEKYFNLGENNLLYENIDNNINLIKYNKINEVTDNPNKYFTQDFINNLQEKFYKNHKEYINNTDNTIVNIHIRRGDAMLLNNKEKKRCYHPDFGYFNYEDNKNILKDTLEFGDNHPGRIISNNIYIDLMNKIKKRYKNVCFNIISQGKNEDFEDIISIFPDCKLYLNCDLIKTFELLINNDILLVGKSSLSYTAGLYSKNLVIANLVQNNWGDKIPSNLKNWIII